MSDYISIHRTSRTFAWIFTVTTWSVLAFTSTPVISADFEPLRSYDRDAVLPPDVRTSDDYTIDREVRHDGYVYQYVLRSRFGAWEISGNSLLQSRLREIDALAELENHSGYSVAVDSAIDGLVEAGSSPFIIAENLSKEPVETVKGIPSGIQKSLSRKWGKVKGTVSAAGDSASKAGSEDGTDQDKAQSAAIAQGEQWLGITDAELSWTRKLGVDPYSTNQVLNKAIEKVARYDAAGQFAAGLAVRTVPAVKYANKVSDTLWDTRPEQLREQNEKILAGAGIDQDLIDEFYGNPWFSPTTQTVIARAIQAMHGVEDLGVVLAKMRQIKTEEASRFAAESIAMLASNHVNDRPLERLTSRARMPVGLTADGLAVTCLAVDHLSWTRVVAEAMDSFGGITGSKGGDMYFSGTVSDRSGEALRAAGWRVHERYERGNRTADR